MTTLRQRAPRIEHPAYLAYVRTLPCTVSGRPAPSDPAHLRSAAPQYGKRLTGMQEKPDDGWVLPLSRDMHEAQHRHGDELAWWSLNGIPDPFALAEALYESRPPMAPARTPKPFTDRPTPARKPKAQRKAVAPGRPLESASSFNRTPARVRQIHSDREGELS